MNLISRKDAREQGLKRYYTGKPCKHGHIVERHVCDGKCLECGRSSSSIYARTNKDAIRAKRKVRYLNNRDDEIADAKKWTGENLDRVRDTQRAYRQANKSKRTATQAKRNAAKLDRTPKWLTKGMLSEIESFYKQAAEADLPMHVDHIVPLQGKLVSGLHVPWNLQLLPASDNISKGNRYDQN